MSLVATPSTTSDPRLGVAEDDDDIRIMERLRDGDCDAIGELVDRYQNELVGFFYHHVWNQIEAEELAQTVFINIFRARARYRVSAKVRTYLYRIAHNALIDHVRRRKRHLSLEAEVGAGGLTLRQVLPAEDAEYVDRDEQARTRERIRVAVEALPEGQRDVFVLANNQGLRYQEVGSVLGIPEGTVKSRMFAAVRSLRAALADLVEDE